MPGQTAKKTEVNDDVYLRIWDMEQKHTTTRWTLMTFYLSVSFALFGISLQNKVLDIPLFVPQAVAVGIYWFAYLMFQRFNDFNEFLRWKLLQLEEKGQTTLHLQSEARQFQNRKISVTRLVFVFGILYTLAGIAISLYAHP